MRKERVRKFSETDPFAFKDFLPFDGINEFVDRLVKDHPKLITLETIGQTYEKRDLRVMKYSTCGGKCNKPILWLDAGIHARYAPFQVVRILIACEYHLNLIIFPRCN